MPLTEQDLEQQFDRKMLTLIEMTIIPRIGDPRVGDSVIITLCRSLEAASKLHEIDDSFHQPAATVPEDLSPKKSQHRGNGTSVSTIEGTTAPVRVLPREQFSYWCLDLLFSVCAASAASAAEEEPAWTRRIAALGLPALLSRCRGVFTTYIVDEALRGNIPFERIREEELLYCLRELPELRLWPGCLWAALSENPTASSASLPPIDPTQSPQQLMSDATKRSPYAHLFNLYPLLYEIATVPRATPSAWIVTHPSSLTNRNSNTRPLTPPDSVTGSAGGSSSPTIASSVEVDARQLAKTCLRAIGKEIGAEV